MKSYWNMTKITTIICFVFFSLSCSTPSAKEITLSNPLAMERQDELIVLEKPFIETKIGNIPAGKFVLLIATDKNPLVVQYDDLDNDGNWDQIVFLYSFKANEKTNFSLSLSDAPATIKTVVRAHVRHREKKPDGSFGDVVTKDTMPPANPPTDFSKDPLPMYLTEGPAWENDKVAFRLYFDMRNGKDVFGKRVSGMVLDTIGANYNNSYHELADWGMDVLHVGKSLGAGSVAIKTKDANGKDTLIRLGGPNVKKEMYEVVADGPVRSIFRIKYSWEINGTPVEITDETSIWGGQLFYESKLAINGLSPDDKLVSGFADFYDNKPGIIDTADSKFFYSYGPQSEQKDNLGLAISVDEDTYHAYEKLMDTLTDVRNSYIVSQKIKKGHPVTYRFYSGWERSDDRFKTEEGFKEFLLKEAILKKFPVIID